MELNKIEALLEKYFEGLTSIADEKELTNYFSQPHVAQHLEQYQSIFQYFKESKLEQFAEKKSLIIKRNQKLMWLSIAASVTVLLGLSVFMYSNLDSKNDDLGTYKNPETAYFETQKQLNLISEHLNTGIKSVGYINEYQQSKNLIFKK